ncbi:MAG: hypothetical protein RL088_1166 [Verrucomicrobiota bacterium]
MNSQLHSIFIRTAPVASANGMVRLSGIECGGASFIRSEWYSRNDMPGKVESNPTLAREANRAAS